MKNKFLEYSTSDWILVFLRIFLGVIFIFSGIVKLIPIEPFELKFVEIGIANWVFAPYLARLLIGFELFLGLMLILNIKPKLTLITTISLLGSFVLYLIYDIILNGNEGNCGCFGSFIKMTPLESIVKNLLMIPLAIALLFLNTKQFIYKLFLIVPIVIVVSIALPFILYPVDDVESYQNANTEKVGYPFPSELMPDFSVKGDSNIDLKNGTYLVSFMSVNCLHCKKIAYKLFILNKDKKLPPIYLVLLGREALMPEFINETKANFPYYIFNEDNFFTIAGNSVPKIFYIKDGIVKAKFDNVTLTEENLDKVLKKP